MVLRPLYGLAVGLTVGLSLGLGLMKYCSQSHMFWSQIHHLLLNVMTSDYVLCPVNTHIFTEYFTSEEIIIIIDYSSFIQICNNAYRFVSLSRATELIWSRDLGLGLGLVVFGLVLGLCLALSGLVLSLGLTMFWSH